MSPTSGLRIVECAPIILDKGHLNALVPMFLKMNKMKKQMTHHQQSGVHVLFRLWRPIFTPVKHSGIQFTPVKHSDIHVAIKYNFPYLLCSLQHASFRYKYSRTLHSVQCMHREQLRVNGNLQEQLTGGFFGLFLGSVSFQKSFIIWTHMEQPVWGGATIDKSLHTRLFSVIIWSIWYQLTV